MSNPVGRYTLTFLARPRRYPLTNRRFADEFEAPLGPPNGFEDGSSESLREDLNLFRRENDFNLD